MVAHEDLCVCLQLMVCCVAREAVVVAQQSIEAGGACRAGELLWGRQGAHALHNPPGIRQTGSKLALRTAYRQPHEGTPLVECGETL